MNRTASLPVLFCIFILTLVRLSPLASAEPLPEYRPALLGRGPRSLVNLIDVPALMKRGQGNATVMFSCGVSSRGEAGNGIFYRGTHDSEKLGKEVVRRCDSAEFEAAVFRHTRVDVWVSGTVTLIIKDGKPHLRIFLNQEEDDLLKGRDFVAPQFVITPGFTKFRGFYWPPNASGHEGLAEVKLAVDANGQVTGSKVVYEFPPKMGFGAEVAGRVTEACFVPGFRDGKRTACQFDWPLNFDRFPQMITG